MLVAEGGTGRVLERVASPSPAPKDKDKGQKNPLPQRVLCNRSHNHFRFSAKVSALLSE